MDNQKNNNDSLQTELNLRKKRVRLIRNSILTVTVLLILIPIILCIGLMFRIKNVEKQIEKLAMEESRNYEEYLANKTEDNSIAYAAEKEKNAKEEDPDSQEAGLITSPEEQLDLETEKNKVYLTFDDGPGKYSDELLDVLAENKIKATFFVVGRTDKHSLEIYKRIVDEGHTLAMHSYSHQYSKIYKSIEAFDKDFKKLSNLLFKTTGIRPNAYRFPGGSSNTVSKIPMKEFIKYLNDKDIAYYDWNVVNGDATGKNLSKDQMIKNVLTGVKQNNNSMVLMHDTVSKDTTVNSLPLLIKKLKKQGYVLLPITKYTKTVQHIKADSVK